jgi:monothiol glutaredoxin
MRPCKATWAVNYTLWLCKPPYRINFQWHPRKRIATIDNASGRDLTKGNASPGSLLQTRSYQLRKGRIMSDIKDWIENEVKSNDIVLFMKGSPSFPQCGFSGQVVQIMDYLDVPYKGINVLENDDLRQGIKDFSNWPTIPQLYVKGEFVGGCDIIREMFQNQELQTLVNSKVSA